MDDSRARTMPVRERAGQLMQTWDDVDRRLRTLVDERPLTAVLAAAAAGYLLARLTSRL